MRAGANAQELAQVADGRVASLLALGVPVLAWVAFNIAAPAFRQLDAMAGKQAAKPKRR